MPLCQDDCGEGDTSCWGGSAWGPRVPVWLLCSSTLRHARWVSEGERSRKSLPEHGSVPRRPELLRTSWESLPRWREAGPLLLSNLRRKRGPWDAVVKGQALILTGAMLRNSSLINNQPYLVVSGGCSILLRCWREKEHCDGASGTAASRPGMQGTCLLIIHPSKRKTSQFSPPSCEPSQSLPCHHRTQTAASISSYKGRHA